MSNQACNTFYQISPHWDDAKGHVYDQQRQQHSADAQADNDKQASDHNLTVIVTVLRTNGGGSDVMSKMTKLLSDGDELNLAGLLNVLDGVVDTPDRILVRPTTTPLRPQPQVLAMRPCPVPHAGPTPTPSPLTRR